MSTISVVLRRANKDYFQAHGQPTQACLHRLLAIADFILRHPKAATEPLEMTITGGLNDAHFAVEKPIQLAQVSREIHAIQPRGGIQGASLTFIYFDAAGEPIPDPVTDAFASVIGERVVPDRLVQHLDSV